MVNTDIIFIKLSRINEFRDTKQEERPLQFQIEHQYQLRQLWKRWDGPMLQILKIIIISHIISHNKQKPTSAAYYKKFPKNFCQSL